MQAFNFSKRNLYFYDERGWPTLVLKTKEIPIRMTPVDPVVSAFPWCVGNSRVTYFMSFMGKQNAFFKFKSLRCWESQGVSHTNQLISSVQRNSYILRKSLYKNTGKWILPCDWAKCFHHTKLIKKTFSQELINSVW